MKFGYRRCRSAFYIKSNLGILLCTAMILSFRFLSLNRIFCFLYIVLCRLLLIIRVVGAIRFFFAQSFQIQLIDI